MSRLGVRSGLAAGVTAIALFAAAPAAHAAVSLDVTGLKGGKAKVLDKVTVEGQVTPATPGPVNVAINVGQLDERTEQVSANGAGKFSLPITVMACCTYKITAEHNGATGGASFNVVVPKLKRSSKGPLVKLFHNKLIEQGFHVRKGKKFTHLTGLAILAFRKTNGLKRNMGYSPKIFRMLLEGKGAFELRYPDEGPDGKHVEADISRQVMTLAEDGRPTHTFHISSGAGNGTPTGKFEFYLRQPGYNGSHMYYSVYFLGEYATHGYSGVPNYPASHGCLRNPIPFSKFIYDWIDFGDKIWIYR